MSEGDFHEKGTLLVFYGMGIPLWSARGLTQTLAPIDASAVVSRSINGGAMDLSSEIFRKFASTISCKDFRPLAFDDIWPGTLVTVDCVCELAYATAGGSPSRPVVAESSRTEGDFTYYRPQLDMMILSPWTFAYEEYRGDYSWQLALEEV